eukprot:13406966-Heterocapsa_arctica.AAC.1
MACSNSQPASTACADSKRPTSPAAAPTKKRQVRIADMFHEEHVLSWKDTPDMDAFVLHTTVPGHRTCIPDCNTLEQLATATMCGRGFGASGRKCFTCCAYWEAKHKGPSFDVEKSSIV